jgi:hypothetical protein
MAMGSDAEKALAKNGYISACIDFAKTENAASSTIGMVQKVGEIQMYLDKIQSVQFKAAEASVVAALSKQHLCDYRL